MACSSRGKLLVSLATKNLSPQIDETTPVILTDTPADLAWGWEADSETFLTETVPPVTAEKIEEICNDDNSNDADYVPSENESDTESGEENEEAVNSNQDREASQQESVVLRRRKRVKRDKVTHNIKWRRQENKHKRMKGDNYSSIKFNILEKKYETMERCARKMGSVCNCKMSKISKKFFCRDFTDEDRKKCFERFWSVSWDEKKMFVSAMVDQIPVKQRKSEGGSDGEASYRRTLTALFHLKKDHIRRRVCKKMFLQTLAIGEWSVLHWIKDKTSATDSGIVQEVTSIAANQLEKPKKMRATAVNQYFTEFLTLLPKMESHYCRAHTTKLYLEPIFQSVQEVYRQYVQKCSEDNIKPLSHTQFRTEFSRLNLSLYRPKKDQCDTCTGYHTGNISIEEYTRHQTLKDAARTRKDLEKQLALEDPSRLIFTMDVQSVLMAPRLSVSVSYYKMKLVVHNFTFFNLSTKQGDCYLWHEGAGNVTANEFTTIILCQIESSLKPDIKTVVIFSDGCGYQNRNVTLANALVAFSIAKNIEIFHYYLEKGHTQMECDSMHAVIERKLKNRIMFVPGCYVAVCRSARNENPYNVHYLDYNYFKNYSVLQNYTSIRPGNKVGDPKVNDIRCLTYRTNGIIEYKLHYNDDWKQLPKRRRLALQDIEVPQLYQTAPKIKPDKFNHLQDLKKYIPSDFHSFYDSLSH